MLTTVLAIASLVVSALTLGGALMAAGAWLERVRSLEDKHGTGMKELRESRTDQDRRIRDLEVQSGRLQERSASHNVAKGRPS